ncbi:DUF4012 domain-containing protein [Microbacterium caowuchunii]|uniref:DUF4012 domain-containing protein n=1 Tax=Microbacterium caowuchunii TaxID=2614638 RepID=UPI001CD4F2D0|nr:DUF4012 domain-containing protein [Microbacterium caowuchunii]
MTRRRSRRLLVLTSLVLLVGLGGAVVHVGWRVVGARDELAAASAAAERAMAALGAGDAGTAALAVDALVAHAEAADPGDDAFWWAAERLPGAGAQLAAVRAVASGLARVGADVASPLLAAARDMADVDLAGLPARLRTVAPELERAERTRAEVQAALSDIDRSGLVDEIADGLGLLDRMLTEVAEVTVPAAEASRILPAVLGADGPRTILVMVQNTAELRTGGGITGTFLQLDVDDGRVTLAGIRDSSDFAPAAEPLLPLRAGERYALGDGIGRFVQNASMTADFSLSARLASAWWQGATAVTPDAVVSVDPIVLAALLGATGPVDTASGPLTAEEVVDRLLVQAYATLSPQEQSAAFAEVAAAALDAMLERGDPLALASALRAPIEDGRISVWSAHEEEQRMIAGTPLAGPLLRHRQAGPGAFAVYLNDATGGKLTPYLQVGLGIGVMACRADGRQEVVVTVELGNALPVDAAETLPVSVTGGGIWGAAVGDIAPTVSVVAPAGWFLGGVRLDGEAVAHAVGEDDGQPAATRRTDIHPGGTRTLSFRFIAPDRAGVEPSLLHTPLLVEPAALPAAVTCAAS